MSDGITIDFDTTELSKKIDAWGLEVNLSAQKTIEVQGKNLLKALMRATPPTISKGDRIAAAENGNDLGTAKQEAEKRIRNALRKTLAVAGKSFVEHTAKIHGTGPMNIWYGELGGKKLNIQWKKIGFSQEEIKRFHYSQTMGRGDRFKYRRTWQIRKGGKSNTWQADFVVTNEDFNKYLASVISHLGRMKASWYKSYQKLGGDKDSDFRVPSWVKDHASASWGSCDTSRMTGSYPQLYIKSWARGVRILQGIVPFVVRQRINAMETDMRMYIKGIKQRYGN